MQVSLELGGKSPQLIFESADLEQAANWAALGICYNTGQDCTAGSRVYVQESVYEKFLDILVPKVKATIIGDGFDEKSTGGPVVSARYRATLVETKPSQISKVQYDRVWSYIESGKAEGAKVILGGEKREGKGFYVEPTSGFFIISSYGMIRYIKATSIQGRPPRDEDRKGGGNFTELIFGPVLCVASFKTEEEGCFLANATSYGLGAGLHSTDASQCMRVSSKLEAGTVWVNQYNLLCNNVPFGGKKQSGIGRELGSYALEEYTSVKAVHWNIGEKLEWPL
uniref:Putative NAD-aldehyde dehydrogenase n=1 Tax=Moniliophthora roreri TaxID=221103 RepID=A0A0W0FCL9_MONRR